MKGYYAIKNKNTGAIYQELMPCGQMRNKMFDAEVKALAFVHSHHMAVEIWDIVFVEVLKHEQSAE